MCLGVELSPFYVDLAFRRWQAFTAEKATLFGDGASFDDIQQIRAPAPTGEASAPAATNGKPCPDRNHRGRRRLKTCAAAVPDPRALSCSPATRVNVRSMDPSRDPILSYWNARLNLARSPGGNGIGWRRSLGPLRITTNLDRGALAAYCGAYASDMSAEPERRPPFKKLSPLYSQTCSVLGGLTPKSLYTRRYSLGDIPNLFLKALPK